MKKLFRTIAAFILWWSEYKNYEKDFVDGGYARDIWFKNTWITVYRPHTFANWVWLYKRWIICGYHIEYPQPPFHPNCEHNISIEFSDREI